MEVAPCDQQHVHCECALPCVRARGSRRPAAALSDEGVRGAIVGVCDDRNLVDPASSHTLVLKIKPCMSKYKQPIL